MTAKRLAELDGRDHQLEQRLAALRDELAAVQRESVSAAAIQRAVALFDPVWDLLLVPERFRILHWLIESVVYDGVTGELELEFNPLGITSLTAKAAMVEGRDPHSGARFTRARRPAAGQAGPDSSLLNRQSDRILQEWLK